MYVVVPGGERGWPVGGRKELVPQVAQQQEEGQKKNGAARGCGGFEFDILARDDQIKIGRKARIMIHQIMTHRVSSGLPLLLTQFNRVWVPITIGQKVHFFDFTFHLSPPPFWWHWNRSSRTDSFWLVRVKWWQYTILECEIWSCGGFCLLVLFCHAALTKSKLQSL
jgi:hypothetical protein